MEGRWACGILCAVLELEIVRAGGVVVMFGVGMNVIAGFVLDWSSVEGMLLQ